MKRGLVAFAILLPLVGVAAALRVPHLGVRPMHADEAVQAARFRELWQQGVYIYDPDEFHGPTLPYATLPPVILGPARSFSETTETTYRAIPVAFGIGIVLLILLLRDALGTAAAVCAALFVALSPAFVFYSRYYIHETLLAFFTLAAMVCACRYLARRTVSWSLATGCCVGLMQATKETAAITYLACLLATMAVWALVRLAGDRVGRAPRSALPVRHLMWAAGAALLVSTLLLSSFLSNPRGPVDGVLTYLPWLRRAGGASPHIYPWYFYLHRLTWWHVADGPIWSEGVIIGLAAIGWAASFFGHGRFVVSGNQRFVQWLGFYTLAMTVIYAMIPYKTPWCALQFLLGMILLAGIGATSLIRVGRATPIRVIVAGFLLAGAGHLGWQAYRASHLMPADVRNPYVFAQTSPDALRLAQVVDQLAATSERPDQTPVQVIWSDPYYWPLPWYLRQFAHVELWTDLPDRTDAAIIIASPEFDTALTKRLGQGYWMTDFYQIRPRVFAQLWVRDDVWRAHLKRLGRI